MLISVLCLHINSRLFHEEFYMKTQSHLLEEQNYHPNREQNLAVTKFLIEVRLLIYVVICQSFVSLVSWDWDNQRSLCRIDFLNCKTRDHRFHYQTYVIGSVGIDEKLFLAEECYWKSCLMS